MGSGDTASDTERVMTDYKVSYYRARCRTKAKIQRPLQGLFPLGMAYKRPEESKESLVLLPVDVAPSLILIFGWMGAAMPHLLKYTKVYDEIYPSSTQVLIRCEPSFFWTSESTARANLTPLIDILEAMGYVGSTESAQSYTEDPPLRILTHCFSNGGATVLSTVHRMITSRRLALLRTAVSAFVLDSNPGRGTFDDSRRAFASSFQNPIVYYCVYLCLITFYCAAWLRGGLVDGIPRSFIEMREDLNADNLLGWMNKKTPRLYLYSQKDDLISVDAVEEHAQQAEVCGFGVRLEKFSDSKHVSHARVYPERYWGSIKNLWQRAVA